MTEAPAGYPVPDYLGPAAPPRRSRRTPVLLAIGTAALLLVGGGAFAAHRALDGGGPQPEDALPGNVVGYAEIDLDPAAGQKVAAYRLAKRFPAAEVTGEESIKDDLLRALFDDGDVDYDADVRPWVGDRAGVAFLDELDEDDEPVVVAALQYTDRGKAEAGLERLAADDEETGYAFGADGYVVIADSVEIAERAVAGAKTGSLSNNERYTSAVDQLGGDQVAIAWADIEGIFELLPDEYLDELAPFLDASPKGSFVIGASVQSDAVEIKGKGIGIDVGELGAPAFSAKGRGQLLSQLPGDSLAAASISGLGESLTATYGQLLEASRSDDELAGFFELVDDIGLTLPADISALLGDEVAVALLPSDGADPDVGARTRGGDPDRALEVIQTVIASFSDQDPDDIPLDGIVEELRGGLVVGSQPEVLDRLAKDGKLGSSESFRDAVADGDAPVAVYVDLAELFDSYGATEFDLSATERKNVKPLQAFGLSADGDEFTVRVTFR